MSLQAQLGSLGSQGSPAPELRAPESRCPPRRGLHGKAPGGLRGARGVTGLSVLCSTGEVCLVHLLLKRNPALFYQHFIECIFHFTGYEKHEGFNRFPQSDRSVPRRGWRGGPEGQHHHQARRPLAGGPGERGPPASPRGCAETVLLCPREKRLFSLKGAKNRERRMRIYKFLLERFTDEQRFNITSRIFESILGRAGQSGAEECGGTAEWLGPSRPAAQGPRHPDPGVLGHRPDVLTPTPSAIGLAC